MFREKKKSLSTLLALLLLCFTSVALAMPQQSEADDSGLMTLCVAFVCALLFGGFIHHMLCACASNVASATEADAYLDRGSFTLTQNEDSFLYTTVTRRAKEKKKSSD